MKLHVLAIGEKVASWMQDGCDDYRRRFPRHLPCEVVALRAEPRSEGRPVERLIAAEAARLLDAVPKGAIRVVLDERGRALTTRELADRIDAWQGEGRDVAFLIGGPDGHDPALREGADLLLSLSAMTLPHGLARVLLVEQLYRAVSLLQGHPYHRE